MLRWQFELTWSLFEYHLELLEPEDFLWAPTVNRWTVHRTEDDSWVPDFAEAEPDPVPLPTVAWVSWHIGWWWGVAADHVHGRTPRERTEVVWPGPGEPTVEWLRELRTDWLDGLDGLTESALAATAPFPWQNDPRHTVGHMVAWVNAELMKNVAEIGGLRMQRSADRPARETGQS
ncbi:DinB family protein [Streptomyces sp. XM4193]|uniref:DinB family protein n=1 Tax=Streptomyces sp. XM4193 TaxID=2929782 RepID=UPI001FFB607C|nr:DinB family protein [Streptomyces sp. XM4193]MCK1796659.1 DinB family protein [Streptomyces sp. XM4193]